MGVVGGRFRFRGNRDLKKKKKRRRGENLRKTKKKNP